MIRGAVGAVGIRARKDIAMKKISFLCLIALALMFQSTLASQSSNNAKIVARDISGVLDGRFTFSGPWAGPWDVDGCLSGNLRHLGLSEMQTSHITDPVTGSLSGGTFTIESANGDLIQGSYTASADMISDDQVQGTATLSITGGTGRFDGATGTVDASFLETLDDLTYSSAKVTWYLAGTIYY